MKKSLFEDEVSIGAFYQRFAHATMDTVETRNLLFEYFVDKIFIDEDTVTVASYFFNSGEELDFETFKEAIETGEVLSLAREFDTSPRSGDAGNSTRNNIYNGQSWFCSIKFWFSCNLRVTCIKRRP